jgi:magnesium-protoporphyrin O-methyltransferase
MLTISYLERRGELETYFDRTAVEAWSRLTSDAPLGRIRQSVRAGRDLMRQTLLGWLPQDLRGATVLDAGCGTGALAVELARRGADVLAIDLSPTLIELARARSAEEAIPGKIDFRAGDMLAPSLGTFDAIVAMDSLIHYRAADMIKVLGFLARRSKHTLLFTFAPRTPALALMHAVGRAFPRKDRAPAIEPIRAPSLHTLIDAELDSAGWRRGRARRIAHGFYTSEAQELVPA